MPVTLELTGDQIAYLAKTRPDLLCDVRSGIVVVEHGLRVPDEHVATIEAIDLSPAVVDAAALAAAKADRRARIDREAEAERLKYITGGAGQAMTYQRKLEEARAAAAEQEPDAEDYPLLAASVGIDGATVAAVAQVVIQMDAAWTVVGAAIEAARLGAKKAIDDAEDESAVRGVQPVWPQP